MEADIPLLEIVRRKEADAAGRLAAARRSAAAAVALARQVAEEAVLAATKRGQAAGDAEGRALLEQAMARADALAASARAGAERWQMFSQEQMEAAVGRAVAVILGGESASAGEAAGRALVPDALAAEERT